MDIDKKSIGINLTILGIVEILLVYLIKLSSTSPTDEFMGITNPSTAYGAYFWSGIILGIALTIIGLMLYLFENKNTNSVYDSNDLDEFQDEEYELDEDIDIDEDVDEDEFVELDDI